MFLHFRFSEMSRSVNGWLTTFRDNLSVPSGNMEPIGCSETSVTTDLRWIRSRKSEDL